jgi:hypothetical protein
MRKLTLRKEVLAELSSDELSAVVGAAQTQVCVTDPCITAPVSQLRCTFSILADVC